MIELYLIEKKENENLCKYIYQSNIDYEIKVIKIGCDINISASPLKDNSYLAPTINFISKDSRCLRLKNSSISMDDISIFTEWVNKANELTQYIYEHYEELVFENKEIISQENIYEK